MAAAPCWPGQALVVPKKKKKTGAAQKRPKPKARRAAPRKVRRVPATRRRALLAGVAALVFGVPLAVVAAIAFAVHVDADDAGPTLDDPVAVNWPEGLSDAEAAQLLLDLRLVDDRLWVELFFRATSASECFESGPHLLTSPLTPRDLRASLCRDSDRPSVKVTFPEGFTRFSIAHRLQDKGVAAEEAFLRATEDQTLVYSLGVELAELEIAATAEGYLFPATYELQRDSPPADVLRRMVGESQRRYRSLRSKYADRVEELSELGYGQREILILASMVEKEAAVADERAVIASVFFNRLSDPDFEPKYLQSDPTAAYGCLTMGDAIPACHDFKGRPTPAILRDEKNIYSTYVTKKLPPGPIANPGAASIEAVLAPAASAYLFFVAKGGGRHHFSETYAEHLEAIARMRNK